MSTQPIDYAALVKEAGGEVLSQPQVRVDIPEYAPGQPDRQQLAYKNNNPGNLEFKNQPGAELGEDGRFARFKDPVSGYRSLIDNVKGNQKGPATLAKYLSRYAPPSENDTAVYIANAAKALKVKPDAPIASIDTEALARFQARQESGSKISGAAGEPSASANKSSPSIDYAALAKEAGGVILSQDATPSPIDYPAIAREAGGEILPASAAEPAPPSRPDAIRGTEAFGGELPQMPKSTTEPTVPLAMQSDQQQTREINEAIAQPPQGRGASFAPMVRNQRGETLPGTPTPADLENLGISIGLGGLGALAQSGVANVAQGAKLADAAVHAYFAGTQGISAVKTVPEAYNLYKAGDYWGAFGKLGQGALEGVLAVAAGAGAKRSLGDAATIATAKRILQEQLNIREAARATAERQAATEAQARAPRLPAPEAEQQPAPTDYGAMARDAGGTVEPTPAPPAAAPAPVIRGEVYDTPNGAVRVAGTTKDTVFYRTEGQTGTSRVTRDQFRVMVTPPAPAARVPSATSAIAATPDEAPPVQTPAPDTSSGNPESAISPHSSEALPADESAAAAHTPATAAPTASSSTPKEPAAQHDYSSTQVNLPEEIAAHVRTAAQAIPDSQLGDEGREDEPHITVKYGLHGDDPAPVRELLAGEGPVTVTLGKASVFSNDDGDVLKVDVDSPALHALNKKIADALPHTDTHPTYQPHVTLAYLKPGEGKQYDGHQIPGVTGRRVTLDSLRFSPKDGNKVDIPLNGSTIDSNASPAAATGSQDEGETLHEPRRPSYPVGVGETTIVRIPGENRALDGRYALRELADVHASHNAFSFEPNPNYQHRNDRDYSTPQNAERIVRQAQQFDPAYLVNDAPDAVNGPPVIDSNGNVLGGNSRTMTLARVYASAPEQAAAYRALIAKKAAQFGLDPDLARRMREPVLVREISAEVDPQRAITDLNKTGTAALTPAERAIADSRRVSGKTLDWIERKIDAEGPDGTLARALEGPSGAQIVNRLVDDGIITPQDKPQFTDERGVLTPEGKQRIVRLMVGRLFRDSAQFEATPPELRNKLERIVAPLAQLGSVPGWDLMPHVQQAIDALQEARAHGIKNLADLAAQSDLFGSAREPYSPEALALAEKFKGKPTEIARAFRQYAGDAALSRPDGTATMFEPPTKDEAFGAAFTEAGAAIAADASLQRLGSAPRSTAEATFRPARAGRAGSIYANPAAMQILRGIAGQRVGAMRFPPKSVAQVRDVLGALRDAATEKGRPHLEQYLASVNSVDEALRRSQEEGAGAVVVPMQHGHPLTLTKALVRHEQFHQTQRGIAGSEVKSDHLDGEQFLDDNRYAQHAAGSLMARGYTDDPQVLALEIGAHLAAGQFEDLGLTEEQAASLAGI